MLQDDDRFQVAQRVAAPPLTVDGLSVEGDPEACLEAAGSLLDAVIRRLPPGSGRRLPIGIASQRSTFLLWDKDSGVPATPMISWQDRRAEPWCARHGALEKLLVGVTGLLLSPHYAGPKLAAMQEQDPVLRAAVHSGRLLFGNLDTWLVWRWTNGRHHRTDLSMAARTAMLDLDHGEWATKLLARYDIPVSMLPRIETSDRVGIELDNGLLMTAGLADQASSALAAFPPGERTALVNFGTAAFVLCSTAGGAERKPGYLTAPLIGSATGDRVYSLEGTINGAGPAVDRFGTESGELPVHDPCPDAFAIPDLAGLGAPHWIPEFGLTLSPGAEIISRTEQRRVVIEGLLFRVREILDDLYPDSGPDRIIVSGGLARDPAVASGLAAVLERPVEIAAETENTLLGVTRLAAGLPPFAGERAIIVEPGDAGHYLVEKYLKWRLWFDQLLDLI